LKKEATSSELTIKMSIVQKIAEIEAEVSPHAGSISSNLLL